MTLHQLVQLCSCGEFRKSQLQMLSQYPRIPNLRMKSLGCESVATLYLPTTSVPP